MNRIYKYIVNILLCLQLAMLCLPSSGQSSVKQAYLDSLQTVYNNTSRNDTAILPLLKSLSKVYLYKDARQAIRYAQEAVDLSAKLGMTPDAMVYLNMARAYGRIPDNESALAKYKMALSIASARKDSSSIATVHSAIGYHYYNLRNVPASVRI